MSAPHLPLSSTTAENAISAERLTRRFGRRWALRGVSVEVSAGEVLGIEGHNGSGKSTLLRILSTAVRPTSGQVTLFGRDIREHPDWARSQVALMAYQPGLYDDLTARENLAFAADMLGRSRHGIDEVLDRVGLLREADERVRTYSSGMQRRLALGRLLLQSPRLLLLDEPYNSLDRDGVALVNEVVREVIHGGRGAALIVLHDRHSALGLLDRVVAMRLGRIDEASAGSSPSVLPTGVRLAVGDRT
ncbi:MAG: heme ABC exporter ATP-binding protein CcmA [Gemmatimonadaceae bacterium]